MIEEALKKISGGGSLSVEEAETVFAAIAQGQVPEAAIETLLVALAKKGETPDEIAGAARAMRRFVTRVKVTSDVVCDVVGTGGDGKGTFNISTAAALVVAGAGVTVAKHGNRAVSSKCGSADILEALGVNINVDVATLERAIAEIGFGFLFAPRHHPAMAHVQPVRKRLARRTIFNVLGPLINPAFPTHQLLGVYDGRLVPVIAQALVGVGIKHALVVCGEGGYDEVITFGTTQVAEVKDGHIKEYELTPEKFGIVRAHALDVLGGDVATNKHIILNTLKGMEGPERDIVVFNAGCALYAADRVHTIKEGVVMASESIDSGHAIKKLNKLIEYTNS
jgi:anthranilate phosphoribosyltransferase